MAITYSIYQRKSDNRWIGRVNIPNDPLTGEKINPKYFTSNLTKRKAIQELQMKIAELIEELEKGDFTQVYKVTVENWLLKYLDVYCKDIEQTTRDGYVHYIKNHIIPEIGQIRLKELKPIHIQGFYNKERSKDRGKDRQGNDIIGYSEKTILQEHRILKRAFDKAVNDGFLHKNPCDSIDSPTPKDRKVNIYNESEFIHLLEKLEGHKMEAIVLIAGMCGLRRGELLGLTWENIDLEEGVIKVHKNRVPTKTGVVTKKPKTEKSYREFTIPSVIIPILKRLRGIGPLCTRLDGQEYHPGSISNLFNKFIIENGLKPIRLHDLRHFNCTMMLKHGVPEREAMERTGHTTTTVYRKYQHVLKEMDTKSADKLNNVFGEKKGEKIGEKGKIKDTR